MASSLLGRLATKTVLGVSATASLAVGISCTHDAAQSVSRNVLRACYGTSSLSGYSQLGRDDSTIGKFIPPGFYKKLKELVDKERLINMAIHKCFEDLPFTPTAVPKEDDEDTGKVIASMIDNIIEDKSLCGYDNSAINEADIDLSKTYSKDHGHVDANPLQDSCDIKRMKVVESMSRFKPPIASLLKNVRIPAEEREEKREESYNYNYKPTFPSWLTEDPSPRLNKTQTGVNLKPCIDLFQNAFCDVKRYINFGISALLGNKYINLMIPSISKPENGAKVGVLMELPYLSKNKKFNTILKYLHLQKKPRGASDNASAVNSVFEISNLHHSHPSGDYDIGKVMNGIGKLIKMENYLKEGGKIDDLLPVVA